MSPLIQEGDRLIGKSVTPELISRKTFNTLKRAGIGGPKDGPGEIDASALNSAANSAKELIELVDPLSRGSRAPIGLGPKGAQETINALKILAK